MFTTNYILGNITILLNIIFLPVDEMIKLGLIICVVIFALVFNLFFFWNKLQQVFLQQVAQKFLLQLYKSEDFVEFLTYRQKRKHSHED